VGIRARCCDAVQYYHARRQPDSRWQALAHVAVLASVGYDVACGSSCAQNSAAVRTTNGAPIMLICRPNVTQRAVMRVTLQGVGHERLFFRSRPIPLPRGGQQACSGDTGSASRRIKSWHMVIVTRPAVLAALAPLQHAFVGQHRTALTTSLIAAAAHSPPPSSSVPRRLVRRAHRRLGGCARSSSSCALSFIFSCRSNSGPAINDSITVTTRICWSM